MHACQQLPGLFLLALAVQPPGAIENQPGVELQGWEVKSLRAGKAQITETYVLLRDGEAWLLGAHFNPLTTASTHGV